MEKLADMIDAILDQTTDNEIKVSIHRNKEGYIEIVMADELSEIGSAYEKTTGDAVSEAFKQLQAFVDDLP